MGQCFMSNNCFRISLGRYHGWSNFCLVNHSKFTDFPKRRKLQLKYIFAKIINQLNIETGVFQNYCLFFGCDNAIIEHYHSNVIVTLKNTSIYFVNQWTILI